MQSRKPYILLCALVLALPVRSSAQQSNLAPTADAPAPTQEAIPALPVHKPKNAPVNEEDRITREVRHELVMQPYYTIWDWLAFRVNGSTVELVGDAYSVGLKRDVLNSVKHIEGVETVIDHINQLPPSPMDDRIRHRVARAIFNWDGLSRYTWSAVSSIHIIASGGRVKLEGIVDSQPDKDAAGIRANGVSGVFQVTNNLRVVKNY
jgi:hyperosmotically inducible protein